MTELSAELKSQIAAAFDDAGVKGSHGDCVDGCQLTYELCVAGGGANCRSNLESCINGCPNGLAGGPEALQTLLDRLAQIESSAG